MPQMSLEMRQRERNLRVQITHMRMTNLKPYTLMPQMSLEMRQRERNLRVQITDMEAELVALAQQGEQLERALEQQQQQQQQQQGQDEAGAGTVEGAGNTPVQH